MQSVRITWNGVQCCIKRVFFRESLLYKNSYINVFRDYAVKKLQNKKCVEHADFLLFKRFMWIYKFEYSYKLFKSYFCCYLVNCLLWQVIWLLYFHLFQQVSIVNLIRNIPKGDFFWTVIVWESWENYLSMTFM